MGHLTRVMDVKIINQEGPGCDFEEMQEHDKDV